MDQRTAQRQPAPRLRTNLDTDFLKLIAILSMLLDHIGAVFFPEYPAFRWVGRLAFPIFCYCMTVGLLYTRDIKRYLGRLGLFALISQPCYILATHPWDWQTEWMNWNIFFTLFLSLLAMWGFQTRRWWLFAAAFLCVSLFNFDYSGNGILLMLIFFLCRERPGLGAGILTRYLLERCSTVPEAVEELGRLTISSNQTLTLADRAGRMAVVECNCQGMEVLEPEPGTDFVVATNSFHGVGMKRYNPALEDTVFSGLRYQVAKKALDDRWGEPVAFAQELLAGKFGFLCQYDRSKGMDTVWSSIYCLSSPGEIYRCEGNPSRQSFERDCRLKF